MYHVLVMEGLLIRGLRQSHVGSTEDWCELVTRTIQGDWPAPAASEQTREAECGLGIVGRPCYFYVLRAEKNFGLVVFILSEDVGADWPSDSRGATPFDSGGWWLGRIVTNPSLDQAGRRTAFRAFDVPLREWQDTFKDHVRVHYDSAASYLNGDAPRSGSEPPGAGVTIVRGEPNSKLAWTWEVRIPHALVAGRLTLRAACMTEALRDAYIDWLWRSSRLDDESLHIQKWVDDHVILPKADESVAQAVEDSIVAEVLNG